MFVLESKKNQNNHFKRKKFQFIIANSQVSCYGNAGISEVT